MPGRTVDRRLRTGALLLAAAIALILGGMVWSYFQPDALVESPLRITRGHTSHWRLRPRFTDTYEIELEAAYHLRWGESDTLLGTEMRSVSLFDPTARSQVDVTWEVRQGDQRLGGGVVRGRGQGDAWDGKTRRRLGECRLVAGRKSMLSITINRDGAVLDDLSPYVLVARSRSSLEALTPIYMLVALVAAILVFGAIVQLATAEAVLSRRSSERATMPDTDRRT